MKTAVSIPDDVYAEAESLARRLKVSRSRLYTNALREFVSRRDPEAITESWNRVVDELGDEAIDPFVSAAAALTLERVEWEE
jgi:metal-responsive CopG/Arc/MetJ family transcriptional regulator